MKKLIKKMLGGSTGDCTLYRNASGTDGKGSKLQLFSGFW